MTQAQAVSREPTMEEILASIRRIIEDGNPPKLDGENDDSSETASTPDVAAFSREFADADVFAPPVKAEVANDMETRHEPSFADMPVIDNDLIEASIAAPESPAISNVPQPFHELRPIISQADAGRAVGARRDRTGRTRAAVRRVGPSSKPLNLLWKSRIASNCRHPGQA
jgi:cell pole-organizing protein PopZ